MRAVARFCVMTFEPFDKKKSKGEIMWEPFSAVPQPLQRLPPVLTPAFLKVVNEKENRFKRFAREE